jgi:hypothetical protein
MISPTTRRAYARCRAGATSHERFTGAALVVVSNLTIRLHEIITARRVRTMTALAARKAIVGM